MSFKKAERKNARLRLALPGTAGAGKTYTGLTIAGILAQSFATKVAWIDSERGSASKYVGAPGIPEFDVCELEEKNIQEYREKIKEAASLGYGVLGIDSYSHSWLGALETVDKMGGNKFSNGWKAVSPLVTKLVDEILSYPGHVIATMRSKAEYAVENINGKAIPKKIGMASVARDGTDYEFDVILDLDPNGGISVSKTRCSALAGGVFTREDVPKIAATLVKWLTEGAQITPRDAMAERIRFVSSEEELKSLVPVLTQLSAEDRAALKPLFLARKAEFVEAPL